MRTSRFLFAVLPALAAGLAFWPAVSGQPVWDDWTLLRPEVLAAPLQPLPFHPDYLRPVGVLSFWIPTPWGPHAINVLLHAINTALLTMLLQRLVDRNDERTWVPVVLGCLYGLHPVLVEPVAFASARFDLLMTTLLSVALVVDLHLRGVVRAGVMAAAFLLAALTKETALVFPAVLFLWHRFLAPDIDWRAQLREHGRTYGALAVGVVGVVALRSAVLGGLAVPQSPVDVGSVVQHGLLVSQTLLADVVLLVWPYGSLSPVHHTTLPVPMTSVRAWVSVGVTFVLLSAAAWALRQRTSSGWLGLALLVALLPTSNLIALDLTGGSYVAERFLTWPALLLVVLVSRWLAPRLRWEPRPLVPLGLAVWLAVGLVGVRETLPHWSNGAALWTWAMQQAPDSALPPTNLARIATDAGDPLRGLALAQRAIALEPGSALAHNNAGQALFELRRHHEAVERFRTAVALAPEAPLYRANLGSALQTAGYLDEALVLLEGEVRRRPQSVQLRRALAATWLTLGRPDRALPHLEHAEPLAGPGDHAVVEEMLATARDPATWIHMADRLRADGAWDDALAALDIAAERGASDVDVAVSRSSVLIERGTPWEAEPVLAAVLAQADADPRPFYNLGVIAAEAGRPNAARRWFTEAARRDGRSARK